MLVIDLGNSALKWGLWQADQLVEHGAHIYDAGKLERLLDNNMPNILAQKEVVICSVASDTLNQQMSRWFIKHWQVAPKFLATQSQQLGVVNAYEDYRQLGVDRWVAMVAAFNKYRQAVCVVDCGTAITLDIVDEKGKHQGGLIMPGVHLMERALLKGAEGIAKVQGELNELSTNTASAVSSGCMQLTSAGLTQLVQHYVSKYSSLLCVVIGGDAEKLMQDIKSDCVHDKYLILYGLKLISQT